MASRRRSSRLLAKSDPKSVTDEVLDNSFNPSEPNLDSSFGLPIPGPATQAIIDELAALEIDIPELDEIPESQLLPNSPQNPDENPSKSVENDTAQLCEAPIENSQISLGPKASFTMKRGKKPKQEKEKQCPLCPKKVNFFRQHLVKTHGWEGKPLKFMLSVFSTQNNKTPVYECQECLYRFTHRQRHLNNFPEHEVKRVTKEEFQMYPNPIIAYMRSKGVLSDRGSAVLAQYSEYCRDKLKKPLANFQYEAISKVFRGTHSLKRPDLLGQTLNKLKEDKNYTYSSVRKLCFDIKLFITWMSAGHQKSYKISKNIINDNLQLWLKETSKECLKEQSKRKLERFSAIPTMDILCEAHDLVENFIESKVLLDSQWHQLKVQEKLALLLFQIHSRANCRVGILTNFTTEELESYTPGTFIRSNKHKTGSLFTNYAYITQIEKSILKELHAEYEEKYGMKPTCIFPGVNDNELTTQSGTIASLMKKLFNISAYKFHPNACRKVWETYYDKNKDQIPIELRKIFESNSAHSDKTRGEHYVAPPTDADLQQLFDATNNIRTQFREKRQSPSFVSSIERDLFEAEVDRASETASLPSQVAPPPDPQPECSTSKIPDLRESTPMKLKRSKEIAEQSDNESGEASSDEPSEKDSAYCPPRSAKMARIPESTPKTRHQTEHLFDQFAQKMLKFVKQGDPHLEKPFKQACGIIASKRVKLTKANIKDIVSSLNLNEKDADLVFKKVYAKAYSSYGSLKI